MFSDLQIAFYSSLISTKTSTTLVCVYMHIFPRKAHSYSSTNAPLIFSELHFWERRLTAIRATQPIVSFHCHGGPWIESPWRPEFSSWFSHSLVFCQPPQPSSTPPCASVGVWSHWKSKVHSGSTLLMIQESVRKGWPHSCNNAIREVWGAQMYSPKDSDSTLQCQMSYVKSQICLKCSHVVWLL